MTDAQREFLQRAAQLARHDMGIAPRGFLQGRMVTVLEEKRWLKYCGYGTHEETGVEEPMYKITPAGEAALAAKNHE